MTSKAEELIAQLEAEIAQRDARIVELEASKAAADDMFRSLGGEIYELNAKLAALKAQQPSVGVVVGALVSALEGIVHDERVPNEVSQDYAALLIEARRLNPCRAQAVPDGEELKVLRAFYQCCASITDQLADSPKSALARLVEAVKDAAASANSEQARSCVTCNGVGIIGHSTLCPECATAPSTQQKESGDE